MKNVIYKIYCNIDDGHIYIGSTNKFTTRKSQHRKNVTNRTGKKYWCKLYQYIRLNGGWSNFTMEIIEDVDISTDIKVREQELICIHMPTLNTNAAHKKTIRSYLATLPSNPE